MIRSYYQTVTNATHCLVHTSSLANVVEQLCIKTCIDLLVEA